MRKSSHSISFERIQSIFYFSLLALFTIGLLYIFRPFLYPIFWAAIVAIIFYPIYTWLCKHTKMPSVSALLSVILVIAVLIVPLILLTVLMIYQSAELYTTVIQNKFFGINTADSATAISSFFEHSFLSPYIETIRTEWTAYLTNATRIISSFLFTKATAITSNLIRFAFMTFIMLYTLYYFLKDGSALLKKIMHLSPLGHTYELLLFSRFTSTARATLKSTFIIGGIQGILGGILFWITDIPGALVWGVIMVILSIIPAVGSFLVWLPAGIIMLALGNVWQGALIISFGALVISTIDNLLRPKMIGSDIQMHPLLVLFSTLGGLALFEISGFVIGPVIAALFLAILSIYDHYYKIDLKKN